MSEAANTAEAETLADYPIRLVMPIRWGEMDAYQHVNNAVYPRYFEEGRMAFFVRTDLDRRKREDNTGPILAGIALRYRYPVTWPDTLVSGLRLARLETTQLVFEHCLFSRAADKVAATGSSDIVWFDYNAGRRAPVPAAFRAQLLEIDPNAEQGEDSRP